MRLRTSIAGAIALALMSGCVHENESAGDASLAAHRFAEAQKSYDVALGEADYAYERRRIDAKRVEAADGAVREELEKMRGTADIAALVRLRDRAVAEGLTADLVLAIQTALDDVLTKKAASVEELVRSRRYGEAVQSQAALAGQSRAGSPLRERFEAIRREAAAYYAERAAAMSSPNRRLFYARIAHSFGGPEIAPEWVKAARGPIQFSFVVDVSQVTCAGAASRITSAFPGTPSGVLANLRVQLACAHDQHSVTRQETYTYTEKESYTEDQVGSVDIPTTTRTQGSTTCEPVMRERWTPGSSTPQNVYDTVCTNTPPTSRTEHHSETTHTAVTKTRDVQRTGTRPVQRTEYQTIASGEARLTLGSDFVDARIGAVGASDDGTATSDASALQQTMYKLTNLVTEAREKRVAPMLEAGTAAARAGRNDEAEEAYVVAMLETGHVSTPFLGYLDSALGIPGTMAQAAAYEGDSKLVLGAAPTLTPNAPKDFAEAGDDGQRGGVSGNEAVFGAALVSSPHLDPQNGRSVAGAYMHFRKGVISALRDSSWGFGVYDFFEIEAFAGFRTTTGFRNTAGDEESGYGFGGGGAYRALLGYRASRFGIFGGIEPRVLVQKLGDVVQTGYFGPIVAQVEFRIAGPAVVTMSGWLSPTASGTHSFGGDLVVPIGRTKAGLRVALEKRWLHTELPLAVPNPDDDTATESAGIRETTLATASIVLPF